MKKIIYIAAFTVVGIQLQFLLHALLEIGYVKLLVRDFVTFGFGLSWTDWYAIHYVLTIVFFIGGTAFGFVQGKKWWQILYVEQRYKNRKWPRWNSLLKKS